MMTSSNGNICSVTGPLWGESDGHQWIPLSKASDAELWWFLFICAWTNSSANNGDAGDLRCHHTHYDVTVMHYLNQGWPNNTVALGYNELILCSDRWWRFIAFCVAKLVMINWILLFQPHKVYSQCKFSYMDWNTLYTIIRQNFHEFWIHDCIKQIFCSNQSCGCVVHLWCVF